MANEVERLLATPGPGPDAAAREARWRALFDHTRQFLALVSPDGRVLEANRAMLDVAGQTRDEVVDRPLWECRLWSEAAATEAQLREAVTKAAEGRPTRSEVSSSRGNGRRSTLDLSLTPVKDAAGTASVLLCEAGDVTERKELERQREEWTSIVAHDLRQPLNNFSLWLGVLERQAHRAGADLTDGLNHARASIKQLDRMISDLLDASRLGAHRLVLQKAPADLAGLVRGVVERLEPELKARVRIEPGEPVEALELDAARIEQVLANLVASSARYGSPGTPITVDLTGKGAEVRVSVVNRGPELSREDSEQLLRRLYRAPGSQAGEISGLGLALYISRSLVEAHGGQIWVESCPGQTTAFRFTLPRGPTHGYRPGT